jgi:signal peptidase I
MGKILTFVLFVAGIFVILFLIETYSPVSISSLLKGGASQPFSESACTEIVTVSGSSMEPTFKEGAVVLFNKCIQGRTEDLKPGTVVLVEPLFQPKRIRIIKKKETLAGEVSYKVYAVKTPSELEDVPASDIKGIYEKK